MHTNSKFIDRGSGPDPLLLKLGGTTTPVPEPTAVRLMLAGLGRVVGRGPTQGKGLAPRSLRERKMVAKVGLPTSTAAGRAAQS